MKYLFAALGGIAISACSNHGPEQPMAKMSGPGVDAVAAEDPFDIVITQFPKAYFGRWGINANDCIAGASDAKGLISVQGSLVKFYESTAVMRKGKRESLHTMSGEFDVEGEGQKWQSNAHYTLSDSQQKLTRADVGRGENIVYTRCSD